MALKFRRGTTAQQSGSLAYGEPYVNTDLGTLLVGGASGDIQLSNTGPTSTFAGASVSASTFVSASTLKVTGNASIDGNLTLGGNITIGDNTSDTVNVTAALSSSLIPQTTNAFDLGSATKFWRDLYISTGSIKMVNPANNQVVTTITAVAGGGIQIGNVQISTASISFVDNNGNVTQNVAQSSSVGSTSNFTTTSSFNSYTSSNDTTNTAQSTRLTTIESVTGSYETKGRSIVSGSSQITYASVSSIPAGIVSGSSQVTPLLPTGVVSGSAQTIANLPTGTISGSSQLSGTTITDLTVVNLTTVNETASVIFSSGSNRFGDAGNDTHSFTGSVQISGSFNLVGSSTATSYNGTINATNGVVSGSSQISHDSTTGFVANKHIDHTSVLISAGNGLSGGGDISSTRTLTLDSGSTHFTGGVKTALNANTVISGSSQVVGSSITTNTVTVGSTAIALGGSATTIAGLSSVTSTGFTGALTGNASTATTLQTARTINGTSFNGSADITIANLVSGSSQITLSSTTGYGSVINQNVLTTSSPTFAGLTINGTITATGDITAYFTSDIRHKNNIELIDNALEKVNALNGVTWDWADDVDEVTKQTPTTGLIAQDVLDVLPEVVKTRENGFLALDYSKMVGLLVEAIKEQDIVIQKLKSDMVGLNTTITVFEDRMKEKGLL